ncbi:MAG: hypothetical protein ACK41E_08195 [Deinococcales bacterium]
MEQQKLPYSTPWLEPQPQFVQVVGLSLPIGNALPDDFGLEDWGVPGDTQ